MFKLKTRLRIAEVPWVKLRKALRLSEGRWVELPKAVRIAEGAWAAATKGLRTGEGLGLRRQVFVGPYSGRYLSPMKVKIHCFEGEWDRKRPQLSIKPLIDLLSLVSSGNDVSSTYRPCQSIQRLTEELRIDGRTLSSKTYQHCLYFAFHGDGNGLWGSEGDRNISFDEIASLLGQKAAGSVIFFGSCGTRATTAALETLKGRTNARLVVGYAAAVDWFDSSVFEMAFFNELCRYQQLGSFRNKIQKLADQDLFSKLRVQLI